jgi:hypothetical protein
MGLPFTGLHRVRGHRETLLRERSVVVWTLGETPRLCFAFAELKSSPVGSSILAS